MRTTKILFWLWIIVLIVNVINAFLMPVMTPEAWNLLLMNLVIVFDKVHLAFYETKLGKNKDWF